MKYAVYYYTKSGHIKKLADVIAKTLDIEAHNIQEGLDEDVDVLFLGTSVYGNAIDPAVVKFFNNMDANVGTIVNFSTSGVSHSTYDEIKQLANSYGISMYPENFHVLGEFAGINSGRPNEDDLVKVTEFTREIMDKF